MSMRQPKARFGVIGSPIVHSLSPIIHRAFAKQWSVDLDYQPIALAVEHLMDGLAQFMAEGGTGLNVTVPHKQTVLGVCHSLSPRAKRAQAVNTLSCNNGQWHGDNTDGVGLIQDLTQRCGLDIRGRRTLLLGAGGAAYGIAPALLDAGVSELIVCNRHVEKADNLVDALNDPARAHSRYWPEADELAHFDLIINATSAGRSATALSLPFHLASTRTVAVDINYGRAAIDFMAWARAASCAQVIDGLGMLVAQAAESFYLWQGVRPDTEAVYALLQTRIDSEGASE